MSKKFKVRSYIFKNENSDNRKFVVAESLQEAIDRPPIDYDILEKCPDCNGELISYPHYENHLYVETIYQCKKCGYCESTN